MTTRPFPWTIVLTATLLITTFSPTPSLASADFTTKSVYTFEQTFTYKTVSYYNAGDYAVVFDTSDSDYVVEIEVESASLPNRNTSGVCRFMATFYDGGNAWDPLLTTVCGGELFKFTSTGKEIYMTFTRERQTSPFVYKGLRFTYKSVAKVQHETAYSYSSESYSTPSFGNSLQPQAPAHQPSIPAKLRREVWIESLLNSYTIQLHIRDSDMPPRGSSGTCDVASLTFYDGRSVHDPVLATVCGEETPDFESSGGHVTVVFEAPVTADRKYQGVYFTYEADDNIVFWTTNVGLIVGICAGCGSLGLVISLIILKRNNDRRRLQAGQIRHVSQPFSMHAVNVPPPPQHNPLHQQQTCVQPIQAPLYTASPPHYIDQVMTHNPSTQQPPPSYAEVAQASREKMETP